MIIRDIKPEDNLEVKKIIQDSLKSLGLALPGTAYFDPQLNDLYDYYAHLAHARYWIIEIEGNIVGGVGVAPFNDQDQICELQKLYLAPQAQGLGLSKKLLDTVLAFASQYYQACYLETLCELKTACGLYEKYDFKLLDQPLTGSDHPAMDAWYLKDLSKA